MRFLKSIIVTGIVGGAIAVAGIANASISADEFVQKASIANMFEIESSKVALARSHNSDVKAFAQKMIDDHSKTADTLTSVLQSSQSGISPESVLDEKHQKMLDELKSTSDDSFDSKYISMQTKAHKKAVKLFSDYSKSGKDAALKTFAAQTLPTLQSHLRHVKKLNG